MEEWADPRALGKLPVLFAPFEITESARALGEMLSLFSWLVEETAENIHHSNPAKHLIHVVRWIELTVNEIVREEESSRVGRADCY